MSPCWVGTIVCMQRSENNLVRMYRKFGMIIDEIASWGDNYVVVDRQL